MTVRRLVPVVLILTLAFAPAALVACEAHCATSEQAGPATAPSHHSCHHIDEPTSSDAASVAGIHVCGHSDELPPASAAAAHAVIHAPAVVPTIVRVEPPLAPLRERTVAAEIPPPIPIASPIPLRV